MELGGGAGFRRRQGASDSGMGEGVSAHRGVQRSESLALRAGASPSPCQDRYNPLLSHPLGAERGELNCPRRAGRSPEPHGAAERISPPFQGSRCVCFFHRNLTSADLTLRGNGMGSKDSTSHQFIFYFFPHSSFPPFISPLQQGKEISDSSLFTGVDIGRVVK